MQPAFELVRGTPTSELLQRHFESWVDAHVDSRTGDEMRNVWRHAVLEPGRAFLERPGKAFRARLVTAAWTLAGGAADEIPDELPLIIEVLHAGSLIVDDVQDGAARRRGAPALHRLVGTPLAINTGNLFYCWAVELIGSLGLPADRELELYRHMSAAMVRAHHGQALDLAVRICDTEQHLVPDVVSSCTDLKAGILTELAATLGAVAAGARGGRFAALRQFGRDLGRGLQMLDDLSALVNSRRFDKALEDLRLARPTWAWSWLARSADAGTFERLQKKARFVTAGGDPSPLAAELSVQIDGFGRREVREHLAAALEAVADRLGPSAGLTVLRQEIERLERSYV